MTEKELRKIFSENMKKYRRKLKLTQAGLAKKAGVSVNFINELEAGKKWASPETLVKIANVFGVQAHELLKPPELAPDDCIGAVRKFADDVHAALEEACHTYIQNETARRQNSGGNVS